MEKEATKFLEEIIRAESVYYQRILYKLDPRKNNQLIDAFKINICKVIMHSEKDYADINEGKEKTREEGINNMLSSEICA